MKAVRMHSYGGPDVLVYEDARVPEPAEGQVLVRVRAAGVNHVDLGIREGLFRDSWHYEMPLILGFDLSGEVAAFGPGVSGLAEGQAVYGTADPALSGAYAEYALCRANELVPKPESLDHAEAASVPLAAVTAHRALHDVAGVEEGQTVLVHGAGGAVGSFAVQFAKLAGARVVGVGSGPGVAYVASLGADEVLDHRKTRFEEAVSGVDVALNVVPTNASAEVFERSLPVLKPGGIVVVSAQPPSEEQTRAAEERGVRAAFVEGTATSGLLAKIAALFDDGRLKTRVGRTLPLPGVGEAHGAGAIGGRPRGKTVLEIA